MLFVPRRITIYPYRQVQCGIVHISQRGRRVEPCNTPPLREKIVFVFQSSIKRAFLAYHWDAVFFGEVFRVDVVAAVHEHLFDVDLLLWRIFHRVVPLERAALDGEAVLFLEATKQLGTMLNSCSSSLKNL